MRGKQVQHAEERAVRRKSGVIMWVAVPLVQGLQYEVEDVKRAMRVAHGFAENFARSRQRVLASDVFQVVN